MRGALEGAAVRVAPTMNAQNVGNIICDARVAGQFRCGCRGCFPAAGWRFGSRAWACATGHCALLAAFQAHLASQFLGLGLITLPASMLEVAAQAYREDSDARKVTASNVRTVNERLESRCRD